MTAGARAEYKYLQVFNIDTRTRYSAANVGTCSHQVCRDDGIVRFGPLHHSDCHSDECQGSRQDEHGMNDEDRKSARAIRGSQMAVVRESFIREVESSEPRQRLRAFLTPDVEEAIRGQMAEWLSDAVLALRVTETALRAVLDGGRFKTQDEMGLPDPRRSADLQRSIWTIDSEDAADLPVYGYAATLGDVRDRDGGGAMRKSLQESFGSARVILDDSLRDRTTFTMHDSLSLLETRAVAPSLIAAPSHLSWPPGGDFKRKNLDWCGANEFFELQMLGGVYVDDIAEVLFDWEPAQVTKDALGHVRFAVAD